MFQELEYTALYIKVLLPLALQQAYTYRVPQELNEEIGVGKRVVVQFGKKKIYTGLIYEIQESPPDGYQAKYILSVLDSLPITSQIELDFWSWIANYYMCTLGEVMNAALPPSMKLESQSRIVLKADVEIDEQMLDALELPIILQLKLSQSLTLDEIDILTKRKNSFKYIQSLYEKGLISIEEEIAEKYKPKLVRFIRFEKAFSGADQQKVLFDELQKSSNLQLHVLMQLLTTDPKNEGVEKGVLIKEKNLSPSSVKTLINKGVLQEFVKQVERITYTGEDSFPINTLTDEQQVAYQETTLAFSNHKTVLLQGITSSGKTHVYIKLIEDAIKDGGQVLYLLPEIALTTQLIRRIQTYFGEKVMIYHSKFNQNERQEIWFKIRKGEGQVLIAPRSGIFMPFRNLKLVIVDEEHENTFKQSEPSPRYHARDASIVLASFYKANVVLGSATPSIESKLNANSGKYAFVELNQRFSGVTPPTFEVVDMTVERKQKLNRGVFSSVLVNKIAETLTNKEQVMLFQNRKGYVPIIECSDCSWSPKCIHCDITLTYYRNENRMRCHLCGYNTPPVAKCSACGNADLRMMGYGTERIEEELQLIFPSARINRLDYENTRTKSAFENIISAFEKKETDILVGTQMLAKGLDFEHLSLVGIIDADHALNFPDFRAYERSFQLYTQVAGRAGRRDKPGLVVIQTNQPKHRIIQQVIEHNYDDFYKNEIIDRDRFEYPPFSRLVKITLKHKDLRLVEQAATQLAVMLALSLDKSLLGPQTPHVARVRNLYIQNLLIKIVKPMPLKGVKTLIDKCVKQVKANKKFYQVRILIDVDPN